MSAPAKPLRGLPEHPYADSDVQYASKTTPLAGGPTFTPEWTREDADIVVSEPSEFARADSRDVIYIADGERIDVTGQDPFNLSGSVVIGGRHKTDVEPGMVVDTEGGPGSVSYRGIFQAHNGTGHVHGIRIRGASWYPERAGRYEQEAPTDARCWPGYHHIEKTGTRSSRDRQREEIFGRGVNIRSSGSTVKNCDIHGFTHAGVSVGAASTAPTNVTVSESQIHNCAVPGLGYPLNIYNGEVLSKNNYYNAYRHSITGFGHPTCGYVSRFDVHGPDALLTPIDMHNLAENGGSSGDLTAGKYVHVDRSTVLASHRFETPTWYSKSSQPAIGIRGTPEDGIYVTNSQFMQGSSSDAFREINVSGFRKWSTSGNEFGKDNWSNEKGVAIDFDEARSRTGAGGGMVSPASEADYYEARRSRQRAFAEHLHELREATRNATGTI